MLFISTFINKAPINMAEESQNPINLWGPYSVSLTQQSWRSKHPICQNIAVILIILHPHTASYTYSLSFSQRKRELLEPNTSTKTRSYNLRNFWVRFFYYKDFSFRWTTDKITSMCSRTFSEWRQRNLYK